MTKQRVNITLDKDVLKAIDAACKATRMERSFFVNQWFFICLVMMGWQLPTDIPGVAGEPRPTRQAAK